VREALVRALDQFDRVKHDDATPYEAARACDAAIAELGQLAGALEALRTSLVRASLAPEPLTPDPRVSRTSLAPQGAS
jgi:hypothetical protein